MRTIKISILALVLAVAACDRAPLTADPVKVAPPATHNDASAPDAFVPKADVAPIRTDTLGVTVDAIIPADAQVIPDLLPAKNDAFVADTMFVKNDALVDTASAKKDAGTQDTITVKTDASASDTTPVKTDVQPPVDTFIVKTDTQPVSVGVLSIKLADDTPVSMILDANTSDNTATKIKLTSVNEKFSVTRLTVENFVSYSSRSITSVRIFDKNMSLFCSGALDSNSRLRCANDSGLIVVDGEHEITIKVNIDQDGVGTPGANSGDVIQMALYVDRSGGYSDDFKAIGVSSGVVLQDADVRDQGDVATTPTFANAPLKIFPDVNSTTIDLVSGALHVIRKTQPTVATVQQLTTMLTANPTIYKFSVTASVNADVALKRFNLDISNVGVALSAFRVYENDFLLDPSLYRVCFGGDADQDVLNCVSDLYAGGTLPTNDLATVMVYFISERAVSAGTTKTYRIDAAAAGVSAGNSVVTKLKDDATASINTATLESSTIDTVNFVWSDTSADIHSATHGKSSSDWTNGKFVKRLPTNVQFVGL